MIVQGRRVVLKAVFLRLELRSSACRGRCKSTKSAIHSALKNSRFRDQGTGSGPLRPPTGRKSIEDATRPSHREKRDESIGRKFAKTNPRFQTPERESYNSGHRRGLDHSRRLRAFQEIDSLDQQDVGQSQSSIGDIPGVRRSMYDERKDDKVFKSVEGKNSTPRLSKRHTRLNLRNLQSKEENVETPEDRVTERRAPGFEPRRRIEIDWVGNGRYIANGKTSQRDDEGMEPLRLPYTTPASEFLYGHGVVTAALRARRRKFYKMYIYQSPQREREKKDMDMREMALDRDVPVERISPDSLRILDRMSEGRPHNGFVLEASPLPRLPVTGFGRMTQPSKSFLAFLAHQSREDEEVNGTDPRIPYNHAFPRFPFVLLLDGILDPQNLGAILRSAFFFGVDAIVLTTNRTAPLSPAALKASAGASEGIPILIINQTRSFLDNCKRNGWKVYASAPDPTLPEQNKRHRHRHCTISTFVSDVSKQPCILILGSEGQGLYKDVQGATDQTISIEGFRQGEMGIDSLNVSVAAGLLCEAFLRKPSAGNEKHQVYSEADDLDLCLRDRLF